MLLNAFHLARRSGVPYNRAFSNWSHIISTLISSMGMLNAGVPIITGLPTYMGNFVIPQAIQGRVVRHFPSVATDQYTSNDRMDRAAENLGVTREFLDQYTNGFVDRLSRQRPQIPQRFQPSER